MFLKSSARVFVPLWRRTTRRRTTAQHHHTRRASMSRARGGTARAKENANADGEIDPRRKITIIFRRANIGPRARQYCRGGDGRRKLRRYSTPLPLRVMNRGQLSSRATKFRFRVTIFAQFRHAESWKTIILTIISSHFYLPIDKNFVTGQNYRFWVYLPIIRTLGTPCSALTTPLRAFRIAFDRE